MDDRVTTNAMLREQDTATIERLERELAAARKDAERYRAVREAHSLLKLYRYDDPSDACSGDWHYKPSPEAVDEFADQLIASTALPTQPPT